MTTPRVILLGLILGMVLCWYMASRAHADECYPPERTRALTLSRHPTAKIIDVPTAETHGFLKAYNDYPPQSSIDGDVMQVNEIPDIPKLIVYFFRDGCAVWTLPISEEQFIKFMTEGNGSPT